MRIQTQRRPSKPSLRFKGAYICELRPQDIPIIWTRESRTRYDRTHNLHDLKVRDFKLNFEKTPIQKTKKVLVVPDFLGLKGPTLFIYTRSDVTTYNHLNALNFMPNALARLQFFQRHQDIQPEKLIAPVGTVFERFIKRHFGDGEKKFKALFQKFFTAVNITTPNAQRVLN
jgi:hypothetical protein